MPATVNIEIASAIQNSTRALMTDVNRQGVPQHCLVLWISSATSTGSNTSGAQATRIALCVHKDLITGGAKVQKMTQVVTEANAKSQQNWGTVIKPDFMGVQAGPFYVRFDFSLKDDPTKLMALNNLPGQPLLVDIERQGYEEKFPV